MKDYEQQDCQLFNTGRFNDIVYAYFVMAARQAKTPNEDVIPLSCQQKRHWSDLEAASSNVPICKKASHKSDLFLIYGWLFFRHQYFTLA